MAQEFKEVAAQRTDMKKYKDNYDKIFGKKENKVKGVELEVIYHNNAKYYPEDMHMNIRRSLDECRKHLAASICKECKCKVNEGVNMSMLEENNRLRQEIDTLTFNKKEL